MIIAGLLGMYAPASFGQQQSASVSTIETKIPNGTPVTLRLVDEISSKSAMSGTKVDFKVVGDVKISGHTVIQDGALGHAQVSAVDKAGFAGNEGSIMISDFNVNAVDGTRIPLAANLSQRGKDKQVLSLALGVLVCLPFLFIKGKEGVIPAGTEKTVYTASDVTVKALP